VRLELFYSRFQSHPFWCEKNKEGIKMTVGANMIQVKNVSANTLVFDYKKDKFIVEIKPNEQTVISIDNLKKFATTFLTNGTLKLVDAGAASTAYKTGTATTASNTATVAHGVGTTPTVVLLDGTGLTFTKDSTNIVVTSTAAVVTFEWVAW
jgi:hypothetical protein